MQTLPSAVHPRIVCDPEIVGGSPTIHGTRVPVRAVACLWHATGDRASAARRKLIEHGVSTGQIRKVAGYGDTVPMGEVAPEDESNRRITVMLKIRSGNNTSA